MSVFLGRIDAAPLSGSEFKPNFLQWIAVLVDTLNQTLESIQTGLNANDNGTLVPSFTTAEITTLALTAANGTLWYDATTNQLKAKVNNAVTVIV